VSLNVAVEVIRDEVVVSVVDNAVNEGRELACIAKHAVANCVEHGSEVGIELEFGVEVGVAEVFDVFCEIAEEEDVLFADFTGNLDLTRC